ncbi:MAG: hypothetical protein ABI692_13255 [Terracoccus sp.]
MPVQGQRERDVLATAVGGLVSGQRNPGRDPVRHHRLRLRDRRPWPLSEPPEPAATADLTRSNAES